MFSVIIPTMWRSHRTIALLKNLSLCNKVQEILVIDNNAKERPKINIDKVKLYNSGKNNFVNPSWNAGVRLANSEFIAICNDDITFNTKIFNQVSKFLEDSLIGIDTSCYELINDENQYKLKEVDKMCHGFGCLMFLSKKNYKKIPDSLKIWFGDNFIFDNFTKKYSLCGLKIDTEMSTTCNNPIYYEIIEQDKKNYSALNKNEC